MRLPARVIEMAEQLTVNPCPGDPPEYLKMCNCYFGPDWYLPNAGLAFVSSHDELRDFGLDLRETPTVYWRSWRSR